MEIYVVTIPPDPDGSLSPSDTTMNIETSLSDLNMDNEDKAPLSII